MKVEKSQDKNQKNVGNVMLQATSSDQLKVLARFLERSNSQQGHHHEGVQRGWPVEASGSRPFGDFGGQALP